MGDLPRKSLFRASTVKRFLARITVRRFLALICCVLFSAVMLYAVQLPNMDGSVRRTSRPHNTQQNSATRKNMTQDAAAAQQASENDSEQMSRILSFTTGAAGAVTKAAEAAEEAKTAAAVTKAAAAAEEAKTAAVPKAAVAAEEAKTAAVPKAAVAASECFYGPDPVPVHRRGQCSGPSHPLGLWVQDAFVADAGFKEAYIIVQDMRKCNTSEYWKPQAELYQIHYTCQFRQWNWMQWDWGAAVAVKSNQIWRPGGVKAEIIIHCAVPTDMRQYGNNTLYKGHARLSVVVTPQLETSKVSQTIKDHGPIPSTNPLGLCAHPYDRIDKTVSVSEHHHLSMCLWAADSYKDRLSVSYSDLPSAAPEWLEYHLHVGVEHFYVYDNSEVERGPLWQLLQPYVKQGLATYIRWTHKPCVPRQVSNVFQRGPYAHRSSQYAANAACIRRYAQYNDWIALFDVDEYLIPAGLGRPPSAKPRLPSTLTEVLAPYTNNPDIYTVGFAHTFHVPCGGKSDPMSIKGSHQEDYVMRTAAAVGDHRRLGAQGENAALFMDAYSCTYPNPINWATVGKGIDCHGGALPNARPVGSPCPPGLTRRSSIGMKTIIKPSKVLFHYVHYSIVAYDGTPISKVQYMHRRLGKVNPTPLLDPLGEGKMLHFRAHQTSIANKAPSENLTRFWLPELQRVVQHPQAVERLQAAFSSMANTAAYVPAYTSQRNLCKNAKAISGLIRVSSVAECEAMCTADPRCVAIDTDGSSCFTNSKCDGAAGSCMIHPSGLSQVTQDFGCKFKDDVDYKGAREHGSARSKEECCKLCIARPMCVAAVFAPKLEGSSCWFQTHQSLSSSDKGNNADGRVACMLHSRNVAGWCSYRKELT